MAGAPEGQPGGYSQRQRLDRLSSLAYTLDHHLTSASDSAPAPRSCTLRRWCSRACPRYCAPPRTASPFTSPNWLACGTLAGSASSPWGPLVPTAQRPAGTGCLGEKVRCPGGGQGESRSPALRSQCLVSWHAQAPHRCRRPCCSAARGCPGRTAHLHALHPTPPRGRPISTGKGGCWPGCCAGHQTALVRLGPAQPFEQAVRRWRQHTLAGPSAATRRRACRCVGLGWLGRTSRPPGCGGTSGCRSASTWPGRNSCCWPPTGNWPGSRSAALPGSKPGTYLLHELAFVHLTSGRQLLLRTEVDPRARDCSLGGPEFGKQSSGAAQPAWTALPGARREARQVAELFARASPRKGGHCCWRQTRQTRQACWRG